MVDGYRIQYGYFQDKGGPEYKEGAGGYNAEPLSRFLGQPAPASVRAIDCVRPLPPEVERKSLEFFNILNFLLAYCPTNPSETQLMESFAKFGVGAGKKIDILHAHLLAKGICT
jgi:hypothetical protein